MKTILAVTLLFVAGPTIAQNTSIAWSALDMGFAAEISPTTTVTAVAGQTIVERTQSSTTFIESGFLSAVFSDTNGGASGPAFILYSRGQSGNNTIWMRAMDGSFDTMICAGSWPRLSHNRRYMLFHYGASSTPWYEDIHVRDMVTGMDTVIFRQDAIVENLLGVDWFDDDYHIVFDKGCDMKMINRDGTGLTTLFSLSCADDEPVARPGGWGLAFENSAYGIVLTDSLGVNRRLLPGTVRLEYWPAWSPDGQWVSFGQQSPTSDSLLNYYKAHPDGTGFTQLTLYAATDHARFWAGGAWTPDGQYLLVPGTVNGVNGIYAIATDSVGVVTRIPTTTGDFVDFVGSVTGNLTTATGVSEHEEHTLPVQFRIAQNYPNPFNPSTTIEYALPSTSHVTLVIYNILGEKVATLVDGMQQAGYKSVVWNAENVASGIYFYRISTVFGQNALTSIRKMVLLR